MFIAEREGFEPPVPLGTAVFKTAVIDHSTISPSDLGGARTLDPMIKSHLLYQLSYQVILGMMLFFCDLGGARTLDPMIKSHLLYQLSYQVMLSILVLNLRLFLDCGCKDREYF